MNRDSLLYFEDVLTYDVQGLSNASSPLAEIPAEDFKRALNAQLEVIKADVANIQHLLET